jgi:multidrug efflux system outer membrane protein
MNSRCAILAAALPLLASCALGPKVATPNASLPATYASQAAAGPASAPIDRWWTLYGDIQLEDLIDQALTNAPNARSAKARLAEAMATRSEALARFRPQGDVEASGSRTTTSTITGPAPITIPGFGTISLTNSGITNAFGASFDVSWEIDLFGRAAATRKQADADLAAARFDYEATRTSLAANVADQLFQARGLAIQLDDARQAARVQHSLLDIACDKTAGGLGAAAEVSQAASEATQADAQVADLETQLHAARRTLLVLVGRGAERLDNLQTQAQADAPPAVPASVPADLLARRPDVREAAAKITAAVGTLKLNELALFPKFTLLPGIGLSSASALGAPTTTDNWSIGLGISQPILDIPRLKSEIRAQGARADQAVITYEKAVQTAYGEADNALVQLDSDEARVSLLVDAEAQGRIAYESAQRRFAAGVDDLTTVLGAERTWRAARRALTDAQVQALRRSVQAFKALGGGWTAPPPRQVATR